MMVCAPSVNDDVAPLTCPDAFGVPLAIVVLGIELQLVPSKIVTVPALTAALVAVTVSVIAGALAPAAITFAPPPRVQVRFWGWLNGTEQSQFAPVADEYVNPVGSTSVTVTMLLVARFPELVTVMV